MSDGKAHEDRQQIRQNVDADPVGRARFYDSDATQSELDRTERAQCEEKQAEKAQRLKEDSRARLHRIVAVIDTIVGILVLAVIWQQSGIFSQQTEIQNMQAEIAANQARTATKQLLIARQEMVEANRAWVLVDRVRLRPATDSGVAKVQVNIDVKNFGAGTANNIRTETDYAFGFGELHPVPAIAKVRAHGDAGSAGPQQGFKQSFLIDRSKFTYETSPFILLTIVYEDQFGNERTTEYCAFVTAQPNRLKPKMEPATLGKIRCSGQNHAT